VRAPVAWAGVEVAGELRFFLRPRFRHGPVTVACDGVSSLGHVVQALGVPLTEVGALTVNGVPAPAGHRLAGGDLMRVYPVRRPQSLSQARFVLDVHLGTLARRLRLLGLDAAYRNDADDDTLISQANEERRMLLTQDRGLLCRRQLRAGAYVRGAKPDDQLTDVLDRFAPSLAPWSRCPACNGMLHEVSKPSVEARLQPGTRRCYQSFARCEDCGHVYWRGAHSHRLEVIIDSAAATLRAARRRRAPEPAAMAVVRMATTTNDMVSEDSRAIPPMTPGATSPLP
jgi:uncharacterized protein